MTGIDSIYEAPLNPEITIDTSKETMDLSVLRVLELIARDQPTSF